jgi:hypothetical protein
MDGSVPYKKLDDIHRSILVKLEQDQAGEMTDSLQG